VLSYFTATGCGVDGAYAPRSAMALRSSPEADATKAQGLRRQAHGRTSPVASSTIILSTGIRPLIDTQIHQEITPA
jgi:hypothetical protein